MSSAQAQKVSQIMDQEQTRLDLVLVSDAIDLDADSLLHKLPHFFDFKVGRNVLPKFLCQFKTKVNSVWKKPSSSRRAQKTARRAIRPGNQLATDGTKQLLCESVFSGGELCAERP